MLRKKRALPTLGMWHLIAGLVVIFGSRIIPNLINRVPLGYDPGIYRYIFEHYPKENVAHFPPILPILMKPFTWVFGLDFVTMWVYPALFVLVGYGMYLVGWKYFSRDAGILSVLLYAVSLTQFEMFAMHYYKNVLAIAFMLFAIYFHDERDYTRLGLFVLFGVLLGGTHRPTFFMFGLAFLIYTLVSALGKSIDWRRLLTNAIAGALTLGLTLTMYIGHIQRTIRPGLESIAKMDVMPGEFFIDFGEYQFFSLIYLPFALMGFIWLARERKFTYLVYWVAINFIIVFFSLMFENRYLIQLDVALIFMAAYGFSVLVGNTPRLGRATLGVLLLAGLIGLGEASLTADPLIGGGELETIRSMQELPDDAFVMATYSTYSPWLRGYSGHEVIAPGLFEHNKWGRKEWALFWSGQRHEELMQDYGNMTVYVYVGKRQPQIRLGECFNETRERVYKYTCGPG